MRGLVVLVLVVVVSGCVVPQVRTPEDVVAKQVDASGRAAGFAGASVVALTVIDVGQGDAVLVRTPEGHALLYDAGPMARAQDVVSALRSAGVSRLDVLVVSDALEDHYGGVASVLKQMGVGVVVEPGHASDAAGWRAMYNAIHAAGVQVDTPAGLGSGGLLPLNDSRVSARVLWPSSLQGDVASDSIVLLVEMGGFKAVLCGDIGFAQEAQLVERDRALLSNVTVAQLCHQGSAGSSGEAWLGVLAPRVATASAGAANAYGDPAAEALERARQAGAVVVRTDLVGTVRVVSDGSAAWAMSCTMGHC